MNDLHDTAGGAGPGSTAASLVAGVKALDPAAWSRLTALYGPLVYSWARRAGLGREDAADVTQNVFRAVFSAAPGIAHGQPGNTFRGWLWTVTRNKIRDFWRRGQPARAAGGSDAHAQLLRVPDPAAASGSGPADYRADELQRVVSLVRNEFEDRTWRAFWRVAVDGYPVAAVARELGMTTNAVYVARSRILRRLRQVAAKQAAAGGPATQAPRPEPG